MTLAIFDLDETLISGDSDHAWGEYIVDRGLVDGETYRQRNDEFYQQYKAGSLDITGYLAFACEVLSRYPMKVLAAERAQFVELKIMPMVLAQGKALVESHREQGHQLLVITSTNAFVTRPIVDLFGIDTLIAPEPEVVDNQYTGNIVGTPSFQEGKVTRLQQWLEGSDQSLAGAYFYSDSHNDLSLLEFVDNPVAVDPDEILRRRAESAGWEIISLRS